MTGYDGGMDAAVCDPPLTTVQGRDRQYGAEAVCRLHTMMTGQNCACICPAQSVWIGKSCGCTGMKHSENDEGFWLERYVYNQMQRNAEQQAFIATDFIHRMTEASDLQELSDRIDQVGHIFTKRIGSIFACAGIGREMPAIRMMSDNMDSRSRCICCFPSGLGETRSPVFCSRPVRSSRHCRLPMILMCLCLPPCIAMVRF